MAWNTSNLTGRTFEWLRVRHRVFPNRHQKSVWRCFCRACGRETDIVGQSLTQGVTTSCGCKVHHTPGPRLTHGHTKFGGWVSPTYRCWLSMIQRCTNPNAPHYQDYAGRGISVCERWRRFENFLTDMKERPSLKHTLERIQNNGNYEPGNVRWATRKEQAQNRRDNHLLTLNGVTMNIQQWAEHLHRNAEILRSRVNLGWSDERVLTEPTHTDRERNPINGQWL